MDFSEITVLEIGEYVAVPYAGKIFSDLGADVIKLEPPNGDVARRVGPFSSGELDLSASGFFGYLNTGKRSVTVPESSGVFQKILPGIIEEYEVDVILEENLAKYGVDPEGLAERYAELSVISLSGYGATGPWREYEAPDIVAWAESGHMNKMGYPDSPPVRPRIKIGDYWTSHAAIISAMTALLHRDIHGVDGQWMDVSKRDAGVSTMDRFIAGYSWSGATTERSGFGYPKHGSDDASGALYETLDGYITAHPTSAGKWEPFCRDFLDRPELIDDERFKTRHDRRQHTEEVSEIIEEFTSKHEKWELFERFQDAGIASAITSTPKDLVEFDHLQERDFWQTVALPDGTEVTMPGFPFRPGGPDHPVEMTRAPELGEHTEEVFSAIGVDPRALLESSDSSVKVTSTGARNDSDDSTDADSLPLEGIRVVDFSWAYAGPHTTKFMSALGADVVKVESKQKPDSSRTTAAYQYDLEPTSSLSAAYNERNQGKRSLRLDLTTDEGRNVALDLIEEADVLIENYSPTFMDRVELAYEDVEHVNPELVYISMPGLAKSGPAKSYRTYGLSLQSLVGLDFISGFPADPPTTAGFSLPDPTAGYVGSITVLSGLYHRYLTGSGVFIEVPQLEMMASLLHKPLMEYMFTEELPERIGARDEDERYVQGVYPCMGDDRWVVLAIESNNQWDQFCRVIGRTELIDRFDSQYSRLANHDEIDDVISEWTIERSREEVRELLRMRDIPVGIVADEEDLVEYDPQLRVREYFTEHEIPGVGEATFQGLPFKMQKASIGFPKRAPQFGEHSEEVLAEWLGYSTDEIQEKEEQGALY